MKITKAHIEYMRQAIGGIINAPTLEQYQSQGLTARRWRWDLFHLAIGSKWVCDNLYGYANDSHIDTALKHICQQATSPAEP